MNILEKITKDERNAYYVQDITDSLKQRIAMLSGQNKWSSEQPKHKDIAVSVAHSVLAKERGEQIEYLHLTLNEIEEWHGLDKTDYVEPMPFPECMTYSGHGSAMRGYAS
jgi:hypothetical protein